MRGILLIAVILGLIYVLVLKKEDVKRFDLDEAENKVEQVERDVQDALDEVQQKLSNALDDK